MTENEIAAEVVDAAYHVHCELGPGLLESVYEAALAYERTQRGLKVARQVVLPVVYRGIRFDEGFRADINVNDKMIVEIKSIEQLAAVHFKQ